MRVDKYRDDWVAREVQLHCTHPHEQMLRWRQECEPNLTPLVAAGALFELPSLVIARWEFLGCLLLGHDKHRSHREQALVYATKFLVPLNRRYGETHPEVLTTVTVAELLIQMMRNRSLHGYTPGPVWEPSSDRCITWYVDSKGLAATHLEFPDPPSSYGPPPGESLHVNGESLLRELLASMEAFAECLREDKPTAEGVPSENFRKGFTWRLVPTD
jgi:hypothetical protein